MSNNGIVGLISPETLRLWAEWEIEEEPFWLHYLDGSVDEFYQRRVDCAVKLLLRAQARQLLKNGKLSGTEIESAQAELTSRKRDLEVAKQVLEFQRMKSSAAGRLHGKKNRKNEKVSEEVWYRAQIRMIDLYQVHPDWDKGRLLLEVEKEIPELRGVDIKTIQNRLKHPKNLDYTFDDEVLEQNRRELNECGHAI